MRFFHNPDELYHSKEWERFRQGLILERMDDDGQVICAHCGKPIVRKYDCIGHHRTELTEENVNDVNVAFNPDNIDLIHFRCHNDIHERYGGYSQRVYLVYGSPCSGKKSYVLDNARPDDLIIDMDRIWDCICTGGWKSKPKRVKANVFGVRDALIDMVRTRTGNWRTAWIIGGYPLRTDRDRLCNLLRAEPIYCEATEAECLERASGKPQEWMEYIREWWEDYTP